MIDIRVRALFKCGSQLLFPLFDKEYPWEILKALPAYIEELIEKGINFSWIIEHSFYEKSHSQERILGRVLERSRLYLDGAVIVGVAHKEDMEEFGIAAKEMDGVVSQLRLTKGIRVAVLLYPVSESGYKVSLRAKGEVDVSEVAGVFGGGGHVQAAGCSINGTAQEATELLLDELKKKL